MLMIFPGWTDQQSDQEPFVWKDMLMVLVVDSFKNVIQRRYLDQTIELEKMDNLIEY